GRDHPRAGHGQRRSARLHLGLGRAGVPEFTEGREETLVDQAEVPVHGGREAVVVVVELPPPGLLVGEGPARRQGEGRPAGLTRVVDPRVGGHAVAGHPGGIETLSSPRTPFSSRLSRASICSKVPPSSGFQSRSSRSSGVRPSSSSIFWSYMIAIVS